MADVRGGLRNGWGVVARITSANGFGCPRLGSVARVAGWAESMAQAGQVRGSSRWGAR